MVRTITPARMRDMEQSFMARTGYPSLLLMEHAAQAVAQELLAMTHGTALFLCGTGNNSGDGLAAARLFQHAGGKPIVWLCGKMEALRGDALVMGKVLAQLGVPVQEIQEVPALPLNCEAIVDALFGTGLARPLEGLHRSLVEMANASGLPILAVDIPSGVDGTTGADGGCAISATVTVTFHRAKPGHYLFPGRARTGRLVVADIGIPSDDDGADGPFLLEENDLSLLLPPRRADSHKGTYGHALIVAGSYGMAGAACLCAEAALRGGAGLVTIACPQSIVPIVQQRVPCAMAVPMPEEDGALSAEAAPTLEKLLPGKRCVAVGPGLRRNASVWAALSPLLTWDGPQVWDADALNLLSDHPEARIPHCYATPHPGEAARLLGASIDSLSENPLQTAQLLAQRLGGTVLYKGASSVITDGERTGLSIRGCPGMAKGGSGDVLTGLCVAMLCLGHSGTDALLLAAYIHGRAGEEAAALHGERAMTAWDLTQALR